MPAEIRGVDAHEHPGTTLGVHFNIESEIAAVNQVHAPNFPSFFCCGRFRQGQEGIMVGAGHAALGLDRLNAVLKGVAYCGVFFVPPAIEMDHVHIHGRKVQASAVGPFQYNRGVAGIFQPHASGQHRIIFKYGVKQDGFYSGDSIKRLDFQRLRFAVPVKGGRQAGQGGFPVIDLVGDIPDVRYRVAVCVAYRKGSNSEISRAVGGIFHRGDVCGEEGVVHLGVIGAQRGKAAPVDQIGQVGIRNPGAAVKVREVILLIDHKGVSKRSRSQFEDTVLFVKGNGHTNYLFPKNCRAYLSIEVQGFQGGFVRILRYQQLAQEYRIHRGDGTISIQVGGPAVRIFGFCIL